MNDGGNIPDLSGILARVTENPQALSMLASLLGGASKKEHAEEHTHKPEDGDFLPALMPQKQKSKKEEDRRRLLLALKPFLSRERCQVLETLILVLDAISLLPKGKEPPCI